ncbi:acyltransferase family protein [Cupriavidus pauculus]|uniref:acyltransferase family protein n=1 Tax=Cupriavidus pauculus TaxID=82633 RepID=UPI0038574AEC
MITNLQLIRAFAALGVVFYHTGYVIPGHTHTELQGVAIFFALSGFLMAYLAQTAESAKDFFARRVVRIVPFYWLITIFSVLWFNYGMGNPPYQWPLIWEWICHDQKQLLIWLSSQHGLGNGALLTQLGKSLLFIPYQNASGDFHPLLGVGWTLNLEMFFYLIFSVSLLCGRKIAPLLAVAIIVGVKIIDSQMGGSNRIIHFYAHEYTWNFVYGIFAYYVWVLLPSVVAKLKWCIVPLVVAFGVFFVWVNFAPHDIRLLVNEYIPVRWAFMLMPVLVVFAGLLLHTVGARATSRLAILLGDASYAIYLTHTVVIGTLYPVGERWEWLSASRSASGVMIAMALSTIIGVLSYLYVEKPLLRIVREWVHRARRAPESTAIPA